MEAYPPTYEVISLERNRHEIHDLESRSWQPDALELMLDSTVQRSGKGGH